MKQAANWILNVIVIWLIAIVVGLLLLPRVADWRFEAVLSGSMEPAFNAGSVVCIKPVEVSSIKTGDIIAYRSSKALITHRVIDVTSYNDAPLFHTMGDANESPDIYPVPPENVVGKVVFDVPYLGYLASFVKTRRGFLATIIIPAIAIMVMEIMDIRKILAENKRAKMISKRQYTAVSRKIDM